MQFTNEWREAQQARARQAVAFYEQTPTQELPSRPPLACTCETQGLCAYCEAVKTSQESGAGGPDADE